MSKAATLGQMANLMSAQISHRNRIINGAMDVDQRQEGAAVTPSGTGYVIDRWKLAMSQASKLTAQRNAGSVTPPAGFQNYLGVTVASAYTPGASDYFLLQQPIEGFNCGDLSWGTTNAQPVSLQFMVYSSLSGTFTGALVNAASNRSYVFTYAITQANTWTPIRLPNIPGDTAGTWTFNSNAAGIMLELSLGAGSSAQGTASAWQSANAYSVSGAVNVVATAGAVFYVTGVQLEKGPLCTPFERKQYGETLLLCQRYFEKSFPEGTAPVDGIAATYQVATSTQGSQIIYPARVVFEVRKRSSPSISFYRSPAGATNGRWSYYTSGWNDCSVISAGTVNNHSFDISMTISGASGYQGYLVSGNWSADCDI